MVVLPRMPACASRSTAQLLAPLLDMSPVSTSATADSWKGLGLSFTPIRPVHMEFVAWVMNRNAPDLSRVFGQTMVSREFTPLGLCLAYFEPDETVSIHAYFGRWLKRFPKDILREISGFCSTLRDEGHGVVYAVADESVDGSKTFIDWLGGTNTGRRHDTGDIYRIDLNRAKI